MVISPSAVARRYDAHSRRAGGQRVATALGCAAVVAVLTGAIGGCASSVPAHPASTAAASDQTYGSLPSYLPPDPVRADSVLIGTAARPALTAQGDTVDVRRPDGSVRVTVTGPAVPAEGLPYETPTTTCTFTVTLRAAAGSRPVPVRVANFAVRDHLGARFSLHAVGSPPPALLAPGRSTTFSLRASLPTGEGLVRWEPDGANVVASWDFVVETD